MKSIKKLLGRSVLYLLIILLLPYLYFLSQAKQAVDTFLVLHPVDGKFQYQWLWVKLDGTISLQNIQFFQDSNDPIFTAKSLEIIPSNLFDLLNIKEHLIYKEFPSQLFVNVNNGESKQSAKLLSLFSINYKPEYLNYFYPEKCINNIDRELPLLHFDISSEFAIHRTADDSFINFTFKSKQLAKVMGAFKLNNFSEQNESSGFISDLTIKFSDLSWLQQNTQKCLKTFNLEESEFYNTYSYFLDKMAKKSNLLLSDGAAESYIDFIFVPQTIELKFDIKEGLTFSQVPLLPIYEYQEKVGLNILLNDKLAPPFFKAYNYISAEETIEQQQANKPNQREKPKMSFISLNRRALKPYLGSKIEIRLHNKKRVVGYIEKVDYQAIKIYQLEHKGKTTLPFLFEDIKSIVLIHAEN